MEVSIVSVVRGQSLTQARLFIGCWGSSGNTLNYKALNKLTNGTLGVAEGKVFACVCVSVFAIIYINIYINVYKFIYSKYDIV